MTATGEGGLAGTPVYMAPEQFRHRRADARTDQFSFCVALYLALYRRHPYLVGASKLYSLEQLADSVTQGQLQVPDTSAAPAGLFDILRRGLRADPKERFASMNELLDSLMSESTPLPAVSLRPVWRRPMLLIAAALGLVGLGALAMSARHPQSVEPLAAVSATPAIPSEPSIAAEISTASQVPTTSGAPSSAIAAVGSAKHPRPVRRPAPPPGRERYLDRLKDPF